MELNKTVYEEGESGVAAKPLKIVFGEQLPFLRETARQKNS
jgi:hypothetical protein